MPFPAKPPTSGKIAFEHNFYTQKYLINCRLSLGDS